MVFLSSLFDLVHAVNLAVRFDGEYFRKRDFCTHFVIVFVPSSSSLSPSLLSPPPPANSVYIWLAGCSCDDYWLMFNDM